MSVKVIYGLDTTFEMVVTSGAKIIQIDS